MKNTQQIGIAVILGGLSILMFGLTSDGSFVATSTTILGVGLFIIGLYIITESNILSQ